jgi:MFS family permease
MSERRHERADTGLSKPDNTGETAADVARSSAPSPGSPWLLVSLLGGMLLVSLDIAVVNVAAPAIRDGLGASGSAVELIVSGYTLSYAMLLITGARLGELRGYRGMYLGGLAGFILASAGCGLAFSAAELVVARLVQGAAAAVLAAQVLTGLQVNFIDEARSRALGLYAAIMSSGAVLGQALGGVLVSANVFGLSWRPIFLINVPIGAALMIFAWRSLPSAPSRPLAPRRLDLLGVFTLTSGVGLVVAPLVLGHEQHWPAWTWLSLTAGLGLLLVFGLLEHRLAARGGHPLVTVELLHRPPVSFALTSLLLSSGTYFGLLLVLALYLQQGLGHSATYSGLMLLPWVIAFGLAGPLLTRSAASWRRRSAPTGALMMAVCYTALALLTTTGHHDTATMIVVLGVGGVGWGLTFSAILTHLSSSVDQRGAPDVSGLFQTTLRVGGTLGVAVFGTTYFANAPRPGLLTATHAFAVTALALALTATAAALAAVTVLRDHQPASGRNQS